MEVVKRGPNYTGDERWLARSPVTGAIEEVDPEGEFVEGELIIKLFYCQSADRYVSIPGGPSLLRVDADGRFVEVVS